MANDAMMNLFNVLYSLGKLLAEDDIGDFPCNPYEGGPGHVYGMPHHGLIGVILQQVGLIGGLASAIVPETRVDDLNSITYEIDELYSEVMNTLT